MPVEHPERFAAPDPAEPQVQEGRRPGPQAQAGQPAASAPDAPSGQAAADVSGGLFGQAAAASSTGAHGQSGQQANPVFESPRIDRSVREQGRPCRDEPTRKERIKDFALEKTPKKLKNPTSFQVRFRTGFVYIAITVVCVLAGNIPTLLMLMATAGICAGEFYFMLRSDAKLPNEALGIIAAMLYPLSVYVFGITGALYVSLVLLLALIVWYVFWMRARIPDVGVSFFGAAYTGLLLSGIVVVRTAIEAPWGGVLVLLIFLSVWANDSFAYLAGSKFGKHKLAPRTSPKKSWEGFIAGLVASMLFWCIMTFVPGVTMGIPQALLFGLVCGLMGVLGDLAESRIKRNSGFKDSGTIMPGHGGLLDRCDSLFLAAVTSAILLIGGGCIPF